jgi:hypothetical protein
MLWFSRKPVLATANVFIRLLTSASAALAIILGSRAPALESEGAMPPTILQEPADESVSLGSTATFQVVAAGSAPLSYSWRFNGVTLEGATYPFLTLSNVALADLGLYSVLVSNAFGTALSQAASLSLSGYSYILNLPAGLYTPIANQLYLGSNTLNEVLPIVPEGTVLLKYDAATQLFGSPDTFFAGVGWFDQDLNPSTTILAPGQGAFIDLTESANLTFVGDVRPPTGPLPLVTNGYNLVSARLPRNARYEEITGLAPVEGATVDLWDASIAEYRTHFFFQGRWTDGAPVAEVGQSVFISFQPPLTITNQPTDQIGVPPGGTVNFSVGARAGRAPIYYQWRLNGVNIPGATNATLPIPNAHAQPTNAGSYQVVIRTGHPLITPDSSKETEVADALTSQSARLQYALPSFPFANNFTAQTNITELSGTIVGHNLQSSRELGEPSHAGKIGGRSVWVTWIAPTNGLVTFQTKGSSFDTLLAAYTGDAVNALTEVASDDDQGGFSTSLITFAANANTSYRIVVDGYNGTTGDIVLSWSQRISLVDPPQITLHPASQLAPTGGTVRFNALATGPPPLTYHWLRNGVALSNRANATLTLFNVQESDVGIYWVRVANPGGSLESKRATLEIAFNSTLLTQDKLEDLLASLRPGSGLRAGAALLGSSGTVPILSAGTIGGQTFANVGSTSEKNEANHAGFLGGASRWLALQAGTNGFITVDTIGSDIDTLLAVYTGSSILNLTEIAQDNNSAPDGLRSVVRFPAFAATIYLIAVDAINGTQGTLTLNWRLDVPPTIVIIALPASQTVFSCETVTFSVAAAGPGPFTYHWQLNGTNIVGATNSTLTLYAVQPDQSGRYRVVVSNPGGSTTSPEAVLQVTTALCLRPDTIRYNASGLFQVLITGAAGRTVIVQTSTNFFTDPWKSIYTNTTGTDPIEFQDTNAGQTPRRFYRAFIPP